MRSKPRSPKKILSIIALIILATELAIMITIETFYAGINVYFEALIDGLALILTTVPLIHFLAIKPYIASREKAIAEIHTEKKQVEATAEALFSAQKNLVTLKAGMDKHSLISITDLEGNITYANEKFCSVSGYSENELVGSSHRLLNSNNQSKGYWQKMFTHTSSGKIWHDEVRNRAKNGQYYWVDTTIIPLYENGQLSGYLSIRTDITELKKQQEALAQLAHYDELTKLPKRTLFVERFNQAMANSKRSHNKIALCFFDLNDFKPINDTHGHDVGDQLLIEVAHRLTTNLRQIDTVSRHGGDEFLAILPGLEDTTIVDTFLQRIQHALAQPFTIENRQIFVSAACGVAIYPDDGDTLEVLLRKSDQAMYQDKLHVKLA